MTISNFVQAKIIIKRMNPIVMMGFIPLRGNLYIYLRRTIEYGGRDNSSPSNVGSVLVVAR